MITDRTEPNHERWHTCEAVISWAGVHLWFVQHDNIKRTHMWKDWAGPIHKLRHTCETVISWAGVYFHIASKPGSLTFAFHVQLHVTWGPHLISLDPSCETRESLSDKRNDSWIWERSHNVPTTHRASNLLYGPPALSGVAQPRRHPAKCWNSLAA